MLSNDPLVSIIVPVYNVEEYLPKCLESLLSQTFKNIEVLLIDDGSTDRSGTICDECAARDSRVKVFHKKNGGASNARNVGLKNSIGDFLCYVDSDDWLNDDYIENLLAPFLSSDGEHFDIVVGRYNLIFDKGMVKRDEGLLRIFAHEVCATSIWNKMYRRQLFSDFQHHAGYVMGEDFLDVWELFHNARAIFYTDKGGYHYLVRPNSLSHGSNMIGLLDSLRAFYQTYCSALNNETVAVLKVLGSRLLQSYIGVVRQFVMGNQSLELKKLNEQVLPTILSIVDGLENNFIREHLKEYFSKGVDGIRNYYKMQLNELRRVDGKIYIYGASGTATFFADTLNKNNIRCAAFLVSAGREAKITDDIFNVKLPVKNIDRIERDNRNAIVMSVSIDAMEVILPPLLADDCEKIFIL